MFFLSDLGRVLNPTAYISPVVGSVDYLKNSLTKKEENLPKADINAFNDVMKNSIGVDIRAFKDAWDASLPMPKTISSELNKNLVPSVEQSTSEQPLNSTPKVEPIKQDYNELDLSSDNITTDDTLQKATETIEDKASIDLDRAQAREDMIRKETQAREDSAYQRAVADMRKAGINPNLVGITPASSGGGITQASRKENVLSSELNAYSSIVNQLANNATEELLQELNLDFSADQATKDRVQKYFSSIFGALGGFGTSNFGALYKIFTK